MSAFLRSFSSFCQPRAFSSFAVAFDLDGVMYRGREVIPSAPEVLKHLSKKNIPWILLTNGGGVTEEDKAVALSDKLMFPISPSRLQQSHTPYRTLLEKHENDLVLAFGSKRAKEIALHYGFKKVVSTPNIHAIHPLIFPDRAPQPGDAPTAEEIGLLESEPIRAVMGFMDPVDYHKDLQILFDVICNNGSIFAPPARVHQDIPVYFSGPDFMYVGEWPSPRFGSGIFPITLNHLYKKEFGKELSFQFFGKPYARTFEYAQGLIENQTRANNLPPVETIYMIGDNPETDILGANSFGGKWKSVLVRTGVFQAAGFENDPTNPADIVADNVGDAIAKIEKMQETQ